MFNERRVGLAVISLSPLESWGGGGERGDTVRGKSGDVRVGRVRAASDFSISTE